MMTQAEIAKRIGVSLDTVKSWNTGRRRPAKVETAALYILAEERVKEAARCLAAVLPESA